MPYINNLEAQTEANENFRQVLFTAKNCQLVLMSLLPGEEIGEEIHDLDQFIRFEAGEGKVILDDVETAVSDGWAVVIPAGVKHNVINSSAETKLKLYTIYTPPEHKDGVIHVTKAEALADHDDHYQA